MIKKWLSIFLSVIMLLVMLPVYNVWANPGVDATLIVKTDKETVKRGETITFSVYIDSDIPFTGIQFDLSIPAGLTYVTNSGKIPGETSSALSFAEASFTENSKRATFGNDTTYAAAGEFKLAEFQCTVDSNASGESTVLVDNVDVTDKNFDSISTSVIGANLVVEVAATGISIDKNTLSLNTGESKTLVATITPPNATNRTIMWTSSAPSVATVDANGKVEAIKKGTTTITAQTADGSFKDTCVVTVVCSHSNTTTIPASASTCEKQGNEEYVTCNDCNVVISGTDKKLPLGAHKLTNHVAIPADHEQGGNIEYWTCDVCDKYFSDSNGITEITEADTKTNKIPHSHSLTYSHDNANHWRECGCGNKIEVANHKYDNACDPTCNICDYTRTITHDYSIEWSTDDTNHWHKCTVCGAKSDIATHTNVEAVESKYLKSKATCIAKAVYYKSCSVCGTKSREIFETGVVDADHHINTEVEGALKETCTTNGYTGDTYCKDCNKKVKDGKIILAQHNYGTSYATDSENHWKECGCGNVIEMNAHTMGEWKNGEEIRERSCSVCGYKEIQKNPVVKEDSDSPKTSDYNNTYMWIAILALSCMSVAMVFVRKRRL